MQSGVCPRKSAWFTLQPCEMSHSAQASLPSSEDLESLDEVKTKEEVFFNDQNKAHTGSMFFLVFVICVHEICMLEKWYDLQGV